MMRKYKRKNCLINKPLQFKYAAMVVATLMIYSVLIIYFVKIILDSALQGTMLSSLIDPKQMLAVQQQNGILLITFIVILALNTLLVGFFWLLAMHKIAGPLYRLDKSIGEIKAGRLPVEIRLRKGDELSDLAHNFNEMVSSLRDAAHRDADSFGWILDQARLLQDGLKGMQSIDADKLKECDSLLARVRDIREKKLGSIAS
jgi:methyl-accepting chemotaxis protein